MKFTVTLCLATTLIALADPAAQAQEMGAAELGLDAGFKLWIIDNVDDNLINISVPFQSVRVGFMASESVEIEGRAGYQGVSQGGDSIYELGMGFGVLVHFPPTPSTRSFIRLGGAVNVAGVSGNSYSQLGFGAALGAKFKLGPQWAIRAEFGGERRLETDDLRGHWDLGANIGFSFFTNAKSE